MVVQKTINIRNNNQLIEIEISVRLQYHQVRLYYNNLYSTLMTPSISLNKGMELTDSIITSIVPIPVYNYIFYIIFFIIYHCKTNFGDLKVRAMMTHLIHLSPQSQTI